MKKLCNFGDQTYILRDRIIYYINKKKLFLLFTQLYLLTFLYELH